MRIHLSKDSDAMDLISEFFEHHDIDTHPVVLWNSETNQPLIPAHLTQTILIMDNVMFWNFFALPGLDQQLVDFCNRHNQIWVFGSHDHAIKFPQVQRREKIERLDRSISKGSLVIMIEATMSDRFYLSKMQNIFTLCYLNWHFKDTVRPTASRLTKTNAAHDYLLTMVLRRRKPQRGILWRELKSRKGLIERGLVSVKPPPKNANDGWIGSSNHKKQWPIGYASMDLYLDCNLEIVSETCYKDLYLFTEKTHKPIMTLTPFLICSNAGYLKWLRDQGFKTFGTLINESYDDHYRVQDRARTMIDVLQHIVDNGSRDFYLASRDILDHNFSRLCEMSGAWDWQFDQMVWRALDHAKF